MRRRDFVQLAGCGLLGAPVLGGAVLNRSVLAAAEAKGLPELFLTEPYLQKPGARKMTIRWVTDKPCESWVEFGTTPAPRYFWLAEKRSATAIAPAISAVVAGNAAGNTTPIEPPTSANNSTTKPLVNESTAQTANYLAHPQ